MHHALNIRSGLKIIEARAQRGYRGTDFSGGVDDVYESPVGG